MSMQIFNQFYMPAINDTLDQVVEKFNAASGNTITLAGSTEIGNYIEESFYDLLSAPSLINIHGTNNSNASEDLSQGLRKDVKLAVAFKPVDFEPIKMDWLKKPTAEAVDVISRQFATRIMQVQINSALDALVASISSEAGAVNDVSGGAGITHSALNTGDGKFGDMSSMLRARFMNGATYHELIGQNITNANQLFMYNGVTVVDILGKLVVVTDSPALSGQVGSPGAPTNIVVSLVEGACRVKEGSLQIEIVPSVSKERIVHTMGSNYNFSLGVKGYSYVGAASPTAAILQDTASWSLVSNSIKGGAGVLCIGDA